MTAKAVAALTSLLSWLRSPRAGWALAPSCKPHGFYFSGASAARAAAQQSPRALKENSSVQIPSLWSSGSSHIPVWEVASVPHVLPRARRILCKRHRVPSTRHHACSPAPVRSCNHKGARLKQDFTAKFHGKFCLVL